MSNLSIASLALYHIFIRP